MCLYCHNTHTDNIKALCEKAGSLRNILSILGARLFARDVVLPTSAATPPGLSCTC